LAGRGARGTAQRANALKPEVPDTPLTTVGTIMKSLLAFLGATTAALSTTAVFAADLPTAKAAPTAEYVKVCNSFGAGYWVIPGSDTCLKIGGAFRTELNYRSNAPGGVANQQAFNLAGQVYTRDNFFMRGRFYLNADARSNTEEGPLVGTLSLRFTDDTLPPGPAGGGKIAVAGLPAGAKANAGLFQGLPSTQTYTDQASIQWAGFTAGVAHSFFDFYTHNYEIQSLTVAVSDQPTTLLGYTFKAGEFSASASIEDPTARRIGDSISDTGKANNNPANKTTAAYLTYGSVRIPDFVGNVKYDNPLVTVQLSGALHDVTSVGIFGCSTLAAIKPAPLNCGNVGDTYFLPLGYVPGGTWGYAFQGGAKVKLDSVAPGDSITGQLNYSKGAMDYSNAINYYSGTSGVYSANQNVGVPVNDAFVLPNGTIGLAVAKGFFLGAQHYWVPTVRSALFGSALWITNPTAAQLLSPGADNARIWDLGVNTFWSPVKGLDLGAEVVYENLHLSGASTLSAANAAGVTVVGYVPVNSNDFRARLRVQYSF